MDVDVGVVMALWDLGTREGKCMIVMYLLFLPFHTMQAVQ